MNFLNKKKNKTRDNAQLYGYSILEFPDTFQTGRISICLIKAALIFCASLGTVGSIVSAFDMKVNFPFIILFLALASLVMSLLHYHHVLFNISYPVIFFLFAFSIIRNRVYANSGYQAITNIIREAYREHFDLSYTRQSTEFVSDRYTTITFALIYLGFFLVVLLNVAISTYMSTFWTIFLTFPFLQFGLYIGKIPSFFYIVLLLFSYTAVVLLKRCGHYSLSENRRKDRPFSIKNSTVSYKGHGNTMGQLTLFALLLSTCFSLIAYPIMNLSLPGSEKTSSLKSATDSVIQNLAQNGFASFFNRYEATGGINGGRLGGVGSVRSDYETDLEVTFVPTGMDTIYLKAFTGATYTGMQWVKPNYAQDGFVNTYGESSLTEYSDFTAHLEAERLALWGEQNPDLNQKGKMVICNKGARGNYLYLPYYTAADSQFSYETDYGLMTGTSDIDQPYTVSYYPYSQYFSEILASDNNRLHSPYAADSTENNYLEYYNMYCKLNYEYIPDNISSVLENTKAEIGKADTLAGQIAKIQTYFVRNFNYTISPGTTPLDQDFVTYFLETQKEGYCVHFATAGTLLCRAYGIPARYVEGYVIQISDLADADLVPEEDVNDWLIGSSSLTDTGVVTVSIPDANAHAWTEIYIEDFGWVPVDFTPPDTDVDTEAEFSSFLDLFSGFFTTQTPTRDDISGQNGNGGAADIFADNLFFLQPAMILVLVLISLPLIWKLAKALHNHSLRKRAYRKGRFDEVLPYYYKKLTNLSVISSLNIVLPHDVFAVINDLVPDKREDTKKALSILEEGLFGRKQISKKDADFFICYVKEICKLL